MVLTGCTAQNSKNKKSQISLPKPNEVIEVKYKKDEIGFRASGRDNFN